METQETTLKQFVEKHGIKFECRQVDSRKDGVMSDSPRHFRCRISKANAGYTVSTETEHRALGTMRSFGLYFSQGMGHTDNPTLIEVLDCLAVDASGYENAVSATSSYQNRGGVSGSSFVNWAEEYGYSEDSRAAEKIFKTVKRQANQLKRVLGEEAYQELLYNTERL